MARALLLAVLAVLVLGLSARGIRVRRSYNSSGYGSYGSGGYGRGSDERDASVSQEGAGGCNGNSDSGKGYGNSGSHELAYNKNGRSSERIRGGRAFSHASTSASASATSFNLNQQPHQR